MFLGSSVSLTCPIDGNPEPSITWYKGAGVNVLFSGKVLNFPQTKSNDTGCYTCSASNLLGTNSLTQCLLVGMLHILAKVKSKKFFVFQVFRPRAAAFYLSIEYVPSFQMTQKDLSVPVSSNQKNRFFGVS